MIRILLVDDHALFRQPLAFMLEREPDMTVAGQAGTLAEARQVIQSAGASTSPWSTSACRTATAWN